MHYSDPFYAFLMHSHLITVIPCVFLGGYLLLVRKGTAIHRLLGKIYMVLMMITAFITLFMPAAVGSRLFNHFGWIHLFTVLTLWTVPTAYLAVRKGNIKAHKRKMMLLYFGALVIAGGFTFVPGRYMHELFFGN
jgi:uncharacterized membrane protein